MPSSHFWESYGPDNMRNLFGLPRNLEIVQLEVTAPQWVHESVDVPMEASEFRV